MDLEGQALARDLRRAICNRCENVTKDLFDRLGRTFYVTLVLETISSKLQDDDIRYMAERLVETSLYREHTIVLPFMTILCDLHKYYLVEELLGDVWCSYRERCDRYTLRQHGMSTMEAMKLERKFLKDARRRISI